MTTGVVWDERFAWHDAGLASTSPWVEPYPALDRPEAKRRLWSLLHASGLADRLISIAARPATDDELLRFHTAAYVERVRSLAAAGGGETGESARLGANGFEVARLAAGGCIAAIDAVLEGRDDTSFGLGSSVFAGKAARSIADKLRAGMTSVNSVMAFAGIPTLPFGGIGDSGFGRIHGDEGIREFTRIKSTAEQVFSIPLNMMSFRQPKDAPKRIRGMIKQIYGEGVIAKAGDLLRKLR